MLTIGTDQCNYSFNITEYTIIDKYFTHIITVICFKKFKNIKQKAVMLMFVFWVAGRRQHFAETALKMEVMCSSETLLSI
jgi:hypothetical protein